MKQIDLHVHSLASDGTLTPEELVKYGAEKGLSAFALTDHDTVSGIDRALGAGKEYGIRVIPGIELSCEYNGQDIHMLGLDIDHRDPVFLSRLEDFCRSRDIRNRQMTEALAKDGIDISMEQLLQEFPGAVLTRSHIAKHLMMKGYVSSVSQGFERYVGPLAPYYIPRRRISPEKAIRWIHEAKGKAVLAHPLLYHLAPEQLRELLTQLKQAGLDGLEAIYSQNTGEQEAQMKQLASEFRLAVSGGSDFHGSNKPGVDLMCGKGNLFVPETLLAPLLGH